MNPTKEQVQVVINTLAIAKGMADSAGHKECPVDMGEVFVSHCGTPMCHGGYYALVKKGADYEDGAHQMAIDLGFEDRYGLQDWADENPLIWGNTDGWAMFDSVDAFGFLFDEDLTDLQQIIDHWKGVQERLPA